MAGLAAALQSGMTRAEIFVGNLDAQDYIVIAVAAVVLLKLVGRRG